MRLHRFYTQTPITEENFDITDSDVIHQWRSVFRYNVGSQVIMFDGSGTDFLCIITSLRPSGASLAVIQKKKKVSTARVKLALVIAITKKDTTELVVQKTTELGVCEIIPVISERTEKKNVDSERLKKIAKEASEQSGRGDVPEIAEVIELSQLLNEPAFAKSLDAPPEKVVLHLDGEPIGEFLSNNKNQEALTIFIGPEGGWTERELEDFALHNIRSVSLGSQILRAETAAIAVCSLLLL